MAGQRIATDIFIYVKPVNSIQEYYNKEALHQHKQVGNRHLEGSYEHFKKFLKKKQLSSIDVTQDLSFRFRKYLLKHLNGGTPANYFTRYKKVLMAATSQGYFKINSSFNIPSSQ